MQPCVFQRKRLHGLVNTNALIHFRCTASLIQGMEDFQKKQNNEG